MTSHPFRLHRSSRRAHRVISLFTLLILVNLLASSLPPAHAGIISSTDHAYSHTTLDPVFGTNTPKRSSLAAAPTVSCTVAPLDKHIFLPAVRSSASPSAQINHPPIARNCSATFPEDTPSVIDLRSVAQDPDGDPLIFTITPASHGSDTLTGGLLTHTPAANFFGDDQVTYQIADGHGESAQATINLTITSVNDPPSVTLSTNVVSGTAPLAATLTVVASDLEQDPLTYSWAFGDGDTSSGSEPQTHRYGHVGSYTAAVTVSDGLLSASASQTITVRVQNDGLPPDPATVAPPNDLSTATNIFSSTVFLYTGANPIQTGVVSGTIEPQQAAVLRGKVLTRSGMPLAGAKISILNHPEYGQTLSRTDGMFDMAVNGGGLLTISYGKDDYLPARRQIQIPWQNYTQVDDVVLIPLDGTVSTVDLTTNIPIQIARGSVISDTDGQRQATLLFPQGTEAEIVLPGGITETLTTLHVRATEYTVGARGIAAMPASLPANSAYTYAVEYSVDEALTAGATAVHFSQPVINYVENFLDFPIGTVVPVGYYDPKKAAWVPSDNGRVIKILGITNGMADLDIDGTGLTADATALTAIGITDAERQRLANLYLSGQSLWRVTISHFSSWDINWGWGPPPDAEVPAQPEPQGDDPTSCPTRRAGSVIECQNQTLGEMLDVVGTPFQLDYQSDRQLGRNAGNSLMIPVSGGSVPASLKRIDLEIEIAGRRFSHVFSAQPNQDFTFTWDGRDSYERFVQGQQVVTVRIGYVYPGVYQPVTRFGYNGNGIPITGSRTRQEITLWQVSTNLIGTWDTQAQGLGGWSLSVQHSYDPQGKTVYLGDGRRRNAQAIGRVVTTVADGAFIGLAVGADGSLYTGGSDDGDIPIYQIKPDGSFSTVAGGGYPVDDLGDGGPATEALILETNGVALGPDGSLYIVDKGHRRIRHVGLDGIIRTVAGNGAYCLYLDLVCGDGGPATQASMVPTDVAVGPDGSIYIGGGSASGIRRVGPDGIIDTVAGNGQFCEYWVDPVCGDGGPATQAQLADQAGIALGPDGSLYIAEGQIHRVRRVGPDGIITTVAGNGIAGYSGDGGSATQAQLNNPSEISVGPDGSLYIADSDNYRIRRVGLDGIITTIAGNGQSCFPANPLCDYEGNAATQTPISYVHDIAIGPDGSLAMVGDNIRQVTPSLPGFSKEYVISSEDGSELFIFDDLGRHVRTTNARTGALLYHFNYNSVGHLTSVIDGDGNTTTIERDSSGKATAIIGPYGQRTNLAMTLDGYLGRVINPAGEATVLTYSSGGLLTSLADPQNNIHRFTYDALGRLTRDADPAGGSQTLDRRELASDAAMSQVIGHQVTITTTMNRGTRYDTENLHTGDQRRIDIMPGGIRNETLIGTDASFTTTAPDGTTTRLVQGPDPRWGMRAPLPATQTIITPGGIIATTTTARTANLVDPSNPASLISQNDAVTTNGRTYSRLYTAATRTFTDTTPMGRQSTMTTDYQGRAVQAQVAGLEPVSYMYDTRGRIKTITEGVGVAARTTTFNYNSNGYPETITDPLGRIVRFAYDAAGRVTRQTLPDDRVIEYAYDTNGNVTNITPPGRPAHSFTYTAINQPASYTPPSVGAGANQTQYAYNADRQLTKIMRPDSQVINLGYDSAGWLSTLTTPRGTTTYSYSPTTGNLAAIDAPGGITTSYSYDGTLPTGETWAGPIAGSVGRTYDNNFRVTATTINGGNTVAYQYDNDSLLTHAGALTLAHNIQNGLLTGTALGSVADSWNYNGFGEPLGYSATISGTVSYAVQYTRDNLGRISAKAETTAGATNTYGYSYDLAGRLIEVKQNGSPIAAYTYDGNGNRLSATIGGTTVNGSYDAQDRLMQYGAASYAYSANGELQSKTSGGQSTNYQYDVLGNLMAATLPDGTQIAYIVDGTNRRIGKRINGVLVQGFLYQGQLNPIAELDGAGNLASRFVYASHANVPDYMIRGGATYRILADHLGSPRLVVDSATGTIVQHMDYDAFGNVVLDTNPGFQPFGFAGGLYDSDTKLTRFGARDYDAEIGQWTAKDPIRFASRDTNFYEYVAGDPINHTDPSGQFLQFLPPIALTAVLLCSVHREVCVGLAAGLYEGLMDDDPEIKTPAEYIEEQGPPDNIAGYAAEYVAREAAKAAKICVTKRPNPTVPYVNSQSDFTVHISGHTAGPMPSESWGRLVEMLQDFWNS